MTIKTIKTNIVVELQTLVEGKKPVTATYRFKTHLPIATVLAELKFDGEMPGFNYDDYTAVDGGFTLGGVDLIVMTIKSDPVGTTTTIETVLAEGVCADADRCGR